MTGSPAAEAPEGATPPAAMPTHGPTCPRRQWFEWGQRDPAQGAPGGAEQAAPPPSRWPCWRREGAPGDDGQQVPRWMQWRRPAGEAGDWPPKSAHEWREQWLKRCGWRASGPRPQPYCAARVPLDDSRWLEDFYDWH